MENLPTSDLMLMRNSKVWIDWYCPGTIIYSDYILGRLRIELEKNRIAVLKDSEKADADYIVNAFFVASGTDSAYTGIEIPQMATPMYGTTIPEIKLFGLDIYHGVFEFYYFVKDHDGKVIRRGDTKGITKSDKVKVFFLNVPVKDIERDVQKPRTF